MTTYNDELVEKAMNAKPREKTKVFFGQCDVSWWACGLVKGAGKVPYDKAQHKRQYTAIDMMINPLPNSPAQFAVERHMIAESDEWARVTLPSLRDLGSHLGNIGGQWVQIDQVPCGGTYFNKAGEKKERTAIKFLVIYPTEPECQVAADAFWAARRQAEEAEGEAAPATEPSPAQPAPQPAAPANGAERETARKFLPALWAASGKDPEKFASKIASMALVAKYFDISSPDVLAIIGSAV